MSTDRYRIVERMFYQNPLCSMSKSINKCFSKKVTSSRNFLIHYPKEFFNFNWIFTILYSVTIVVVKLIYQKKNLYWLFSISVSLKYNRVFVYSHCFWKCSFRFHCFQNWWTSTQYCTLLYFLFIEALHWNV